MLNSFQAFKGWIVITVHLGLRQGVPFCLPQVEDEQGHLKDIQPTNITEDSFQWKIPYREKNVARVSGFFCTRGYKMETVFEIPKDVYPKKEQNDFLKADLEAMKKEYEGYAEFEGKEKALKEKMEKAQADFEDLCRQYDQALAETLDTKKGVNKTLIGKRLKAQEEAEKTSVEYYNFQESVKATLGKQSLIWGGKEAVK